MRKKPALIVAVLLICIFIWSNLQAQSAAEKPADRAISAVRALKEGVLIVVIPANQQKAAKLEEFISQSKGSRRQYFETLLEETRAETEAVATDIVRSMQSEYHFSDMVFVYDTAVNQLRQGIYSGYFLDTLLKPAPALSIAGRSYFIFKQNPYEDNWLVADSSLETMAPPFPYKTPGRRILIFRLSMRFTARYLDKKLSSFYLENSDR